MQRPISGGPGAPAAPLRGDAPRLAHHEAARLRAAALHARRVHHGRLGELIARELLAYAEFGYGFAADGLIPQLAVEILATRTPPLPTAVGDDRAGG